MVHEFVGFLDKLWKWDLAFCDSLQNLPNNLRLKSLEKLYDLCGCFMLEKFPNIHQEMKRNVTPTQHVIKTIKCVN